MLPEGIKAQIISAIKNHQKEFITNYNREKSGHREEIFIFVCFLSQYLAEIYQLLMKREKEGFSKPMRLNFIWLLRLPLPPAHAHSFFSPLPD